MLSWGMEDSVSRHPFYKFYDLVTQKILFAVISNPVIRSYHKYAHVMAGLLWNEQNFDLVASSFVKSEQHIFSRDLNYELVNPLWIGSMM